jgi:hypothetical protein
VEKRYSAGLTLNAFYTFSKSLNNGDNDGGVSGIDFYNRALEKARANYDIRHRFVSVKTYELPFGKGRKFMSGGGIKDTILGGWEIAWTQTFQSGPPFTVSFAGSPFNYLPGATRPNLVSGVAPVTPNWSIGPHRFPVQAQVPYLNADAFAYPDQFTPGTMGRNVVEAPGLTWPQFSLSKQWQILERFRFILRWDSNNPFKSPNFGQPNSVFNRQNLANFGRVGTATPRRLLRYWHRPAQSSDRVPPGILIPTATAVSRRAYPARGAAAAPVQDPHRDSGIICTLCSGDIS